MKSTRRRCRHHCTLFPPICHASSSCTSANQLMPFVVSKYHLILLNLSPAIRPAGAVGGAAS
jgi:hypothetical protein